MPPKWGFFMAIQTSVRDPNRVTSLIGVDSTLFTDATTAAVNPTTHALLVEATTSTVDQEVDLVKVGGAAFSLGQQLAAASLPVVLTAAQITTLTPLATVAVTQSTSPWVVSGTVKETRAATSVVTQVGDSASSVTLLASNANRLGVTVTNLSSAILYIKLGTAASATDCTAVIYQNGYWSDELYTGRIDGIWVSDAGGVASITELTA